MSGILIAFVGLIYAYIAGENFVKGHIWMGIVFTGYALSNVGLYKLAEQ